MKTVAAAVAMLFLGGPALGATVTTQETGEVVFLEDGATYTRITAGAFGPGWTWASQGQLEGLQTKIASSVRRELTGVLDIPATDASARLAETVSRADDRTVRCEYTFELSKDAEVNSLWVSFFLPCDRYAGLKVAAYEADGEAVGSVALPERLGEVRLLTHERAQRVVVASGTSVGYEIVFPDGAEMMLQDNREWGGTEYELRLDLLGEYRGRVTPGGTRLSEVIAITFEDPVEFQLDPETARSRTDTDGWAPFVLPWDGAPLDLSWLNEKPAGQHGFLTVKDGRFVFEDRTPARFWGVCVSAAANFPTHEQADIIAERMAKFGINMVRTHHADAGWSDPNLFDDEGGDTRHFDAEALDRFDYFISCLKRHGIYVYLDQLVHRKFTEADGVENAEALDFAAKPYTIFDPKLIELQQEFSRALWTHVNPYTGIAYKDDPAIALMDYTNENDLMVYDVTVEPYATRLEERWRKWAAAHGVSPDQPLRRHRERTPDVLRFLDEVQRRYYREMEHYLRGIGVRVPITGNTWLVVGANLPSQATMDFMDAHAYWDHPQDWKRFHNEAQVRADPRDRGSNFATLAMSRVAGKPFMCSEWGHPWPNEWRAEGPLATAAVAAFQGWDGVLAYTYRHDTEVPVDRITGFFDTFNDPCVFGLMPAAALMFRRGDVAAGETAAVRWTEDDVFAQEQLNAWDAQPAYRSLVEAHRVATTLGEPEGADLVAGPREFVETSGESWVKSDTGELRRDWEVGVGTIDTSRSQAAYGFFGRAGPIELSEVTIEVENEFGVVAVTSLDGKAIRESRHVLVSAVGRAENTGTVYNLTRTELREHGEGPILIEPIKGQVEIRHRGRSFTVYALGPDGARRELAAGLSDDGLTVRLGEGTIYYEVVVE